MPNFITLSFDYTLNGMTKWAKDVAHEATDELRKLLADGVAGIEHEAQEAEHAVEGTPEAQ